MDKKIRIPLDRDVARLLKSGDRVLLSGVMYTARDAAHKRLMEGGNLPFDPEGAVIYYVGPSPAGEGRLIGSAGPTTSYRMDPFTPWMLEKGILGLIGKGKRSIQVTESLKKHGAVYFAAIGGAGALLSDSIVKSEVIAYEDLGPEAIRRLEVRDFPAIVVIDSQGNDLYETERKKYKR